MVTSNAIVPTQEHRAIGLISTHATHQHNGKLPHLSHRSLAQPSATWINWTASLLLILLLLFTTSVNIFYLLKYNNVVSVDFPDIYAADKEWLFSDYQTGPISTSLVRDFIVSDSLQAVSRLKSAIFTAPPGEVNASTPCISVVRHDAGSLYAFCDRFNASEMPAWAQDFDALILQTIYHLATIEQHAQGHKATPFVGVAQGFRNNRTGWYQQDSIGQFYCTTKQLAEPSKEAFTASAIHESAWRAAQRRLCFANRKQCSCVCEATQHRQRFVLFGDATGIVHDYEVLQSESGEYFILSPFSSFGSIGQRTEFVSTWPIDACLYRRGSSIGWLGAGQSSYQVQIPTLALAAKLQLISMLLVVWLIKCRVALYRLHHALYELSRLGAFIFLVLQLLLSAHHEQDIMRAIYSWERRSASDWLLFWYIELGLCPRLLING